MELIQDKADKTRVLNIGGPQFLQQIGEDNQLVQKITDSGNCGSFSNTVIKMALGPFTIIITYYYISNKKCLCSEPKEQFLPRLGPLQWITWFLTQISLLLSPVLSHPHAMYASSSPSLQA